MERGVHVRVCVGRMCYNSEDGDCPPLSLQSRELEAMQSDYESRRKELEQLLQSVDQQVSIGHMRVASHPHTHTPSHALTHILIPTPSPHTPTPSYSPHTHTFMPTEVRSGGKAEATAGGGN